MAVELFLCLLPVAVEKFSIFLLPVAVAHKIFSTATQKVAVDNKNFATASGSRKGFYISTVSLELANQI